MSGVSRLTGTLGAIAIALGVTLAPLGAQQARDADAIFLRARAAAEARVLPPFLEYTTYAAFVRRGHIDAEHYHVIVRTSDGMTYVTPVPDSPAPFWPPGMVSEGAGISNILVSSGMSAACGA